MAKRPKLILVIDCNWFISASINRKSRRTLFNILINPKYKIVYSKELLDEYYLVIKRDKFKKLIRPLQVSRFVNFIKPLMHKVRLETMINLSRDLKDNYLLSLSVKSKADYLITGDDDLLILKSINKTQIINLSDFLNTEMKFHNRDKSN